MHGSSREIQAGTRQPTAAQTTYALQAAIANDLHTAHPPPVELDGRGETVRDAAFARRDDVKPPSHRPVKGRGKRSGTISARRFAPGRKETGGERLLPVCVQRTSAPFEPRANAQAHVHARCQQRDRAKQDVHIECRRRDIVAAQTAIAGVVAILGPVEPRLVRRGQHVKLPPRGEPAPRPAPPHTPRCTTSNVCA